MKDYHLHIYLPRYGPLVDFIKKEIPSAEINIIGFMPLIQRSMLSVRGMISVIKSSYKFQAFFKSEHEKQKFTLVYVNTLASVLSLLSIRKLNVPKLIHVHEIIEKPRFVAKITAEIAMKYAVKVICVSQAVKDNIIINSSRDASHVQVLRNGIKPINEITHLPNFKVEFYLFGRIKPEKGQWYLLEALSHLHEDVLKCANFNLVGGTANGSDHLLDELNEIINAQQLADKINIIGFTPDISKLLSKADVCLIPSLMKDPFPTTVLEAMSLGKTIITTDGGGAKEAISNGESGIIIPVNQSTLFAQKIKEVIMDRKMAENLGRNAKIAFETNFTEEHFSEKWNLMISELISHNGNKQPIMILQ
jgi:glycosyltransferase involved in cell wall biosynthesis